MTEAHPTHRTAECHTAMVALQVDLQCTILGRGVLTKHTFIWLLACKIEQNSLYKVHTVELAYIGLGYIFIKLYKIFGSHENHGNSLVYIGFRIYRTRLYHIIGYIG